MSYSLTDEIKENEQMRLNQVNGQLKGMKHKWAIFWCFLEDIDFYSEIANKKPNGKKKFPHTSRYQLEQLQYINRNNYLRRRCNKIR